MASSRDKDEVASSLSKLNIDVAATKKKPAASKQKPAEVADSWEDEDDEEDSPSKDAAPRGITTITTTCTSTLTDAATTG